jgi:glyoxylase-like metal-dependent hydrolase (beta-lactamase superfamily II)
MTDQAAVPAVQDLGGVLLLDTRHDGYPGTVGVFLLPLDGGAFALVESGPGSTVSAVESAIGLAGFETGGLEHILLTHIHLDHAGAAGELALKSGARVHVHHRGAPHLVDPGKLLESAGRIYGERMDSLWGRMEAVPAEQLNAVYDGDLLRLGDRVLEVLDTPGHARHHAAFLLDGDTLFTGDAAAIRFPPANLIRPALPPPEADLEAWEASIAKMRSTVPERLLLTHFGEIRTADEHLAALPERNRLWANEVLEGLRSGEEHGALERRVAELAEREFQSLDVPEELAQRYRVTSDAAMTAMGLERYWRKHHPELAVPS